MAQDVALSGLFAGVDAMPARLDPALEEAIDRQKRERELQELKVSPPPVCGIFPSFHFVGEHGLPGGLHQCAAQGH